ncbi:MAG: PD-(D/E)XK motif protein [Tepidisphaeraceae bacterium]
MSLSARNVLTVLNELSTPVKDSRGGERFSTASLPGTSSHLIGLDAERHVVILLAIDHTQPMAVSPSIRLENIEVQHGVRCTIPSQVAGAPTVFTIIRCLSDDSDLIEIFVDVMMPVARGFGLPVPLADAVSTMDKVVRVFRQQVAPNQHTVQGLWSELFLIAAASDPVAVASAWRTDPFESSDFSTPTCRVEVKSTTGPIRSHHFNHEQLRSIAGVTSIIASMFCRRAAGGISVAELWELVRRHVGGMPDLSLRIDATVMHTLGESWKASLKTRFDHQLARSSLRFFSVESIPSIGNDLPSELSEIRYRVDVTTVPPLGHEQLGVPGELGRQMWPSYVL